MGDRVIESFVVPPGLYQVIRHTAVTCKFCRIVYTPRALFDVRRVCPECMTQVESIAGTIGVSGSRVSLVVVGYSRWTGAIRYGRPWQEHVRDRSILNSARPHRRHLGHRP